jgi:hypothetical protein
VGLVDRRMSERRLDKEWRWIQTILAIVDGSICNTGMEWLKRHAYYSWEFCRTENVQFKDTANLFKLPFLANMRSLRRRENNDSE